MLEKLYTKDVLRLTTAISHLGRLTDPDGTATEKSRQCGSLMTVDVAMDKGRIARFGQELQACALSQASAALTAEQVIGRTEAELQTAYDQIERMLKENGPIPDAPWDGYGTLQAVRDFPPRHESVLLPLKCTLTAIRQAS